MRFVYLMWFVILCDPQWWVAAKTVGFVTKIPTPFYGLMLILVAMRPPKSWFPPFLAFILYTIAVIPLAYNRGYSMGVAKMLIAYYTVAIGALALLRNVKLSVPIIAGQMMYSYLWWMPWTIPGRVSWHPSLANFDGFGPLMCVGLGSCYYFGVATNLKKERNLAWAVALGCIVGLVASFARGAVLAGGLVLFWIWLRSPNKLKTGAAAAVGLLGVLIVAPLFGTKRSEQHNNFFQEMATVFDSKDDGTRDDREVLWALARRAYLDHPLLGVGANNFGPYAAQTFKVGDTGGGYDENPERLYDRQLHSTYYQILCEYGTIGSLIFVWMLVDFWWRNRALRRKDFRYTWAVRSGGRLELRALSLGLECAMIGFLSSGLFYNQIFSIHWFYSIIAINTLLYYHAKPKRQRRVVGTAPQPA